MKGGFTGIEDLDKLILHKLNDRDLLITCLVDKTLVNICNDEAFWIERFINVFGRDKLSNNNTNKSWKQYYLEIIHDLDIINNNYDDLMNAILSVAVRIEGTNKISQRIEEKLERILLNGYYYYTVYDNSELTIEYPTDRDEVGAPIDRIYHSSDGFKPYQIVKFVEDFYNEPLNIEEFEELQEVDNPYAEDYTEEQVERGEVTRGMMINMFWEQFTQVDEDTYTLNLGS